MKTLVRQFTAEINRRLNRIKKAVYDLIVTEDAFGLQVDEKRISDFLSNRSNARAVQGQPPGYSTLSLAGLPASNQPVTPPSTVQITSPSDPGAGGFSSREEVSDGREKGTAEDGDSGRVRGGIRAVGVRNEADNLLGKVATLPVLHNQRFRFASTEQQVKQFEEWLKGIIQLHLSSAEAVKDAYWHKFIEEGYRKGAGRAFDDTKAAQRVAAEQDPQAYAFYEGTKEEFLRSSFARPEAIEKVKLLASRTFDELGGMTDDMRNRMRRTLLDGLVQGKGVMPIVRQLSKDIDISRSRAKTIVRTECLPGDTLVDAAVVRAVFRRWYEGPMVEIVTRSGRKFTATPNHPMLTKRGWIGAGSLNELDSLICDGREKNSGSSSYQDVETRPTSISEIFDSFNTIGIAERVPTLDVDFHGDGVDGEVDVFYPDGELLLGDFAPVGKPAVQSLFTPTDMVNGPRFCSICGRLLPVNESVCLCLGSNVDSLFNQSILDGGAVGIESLGEGDETFTANISSSDFPFREVAPVLIGDASFVPTEQLSFSIGSRDARRTENGSDRLLITPDFRGNLPLSEPSDIEIDDVLSVSVRPFAGHVYNLQTPYGYFTIQGSAHAEGILVGGAYTGNTTRVHAEGALDAMEKLGVERIGAMVEWSTAGYNVCPLCAEMEGVVMTLTEMRGLIPRHPNCFVDPNTAIWTDKGWKAIVDIRVGDWVLTHRGRYKQVTQLHRDERECIVVNIFTGDFTKNCCLRVTAEHPVRTLHGPWTPASHVHFRDVLEVMYWPTAHVHYSACATVNEVKIQAPEVHKTYNISVETDESYVVLGGSLDYGMLGFIVHNCACTPIPANVGEPTDRSRTFTVRKGTKEYTKTVEGQTRGKEGVQRAIDKSIAAEIPKTKPRSLERQKEITRWPGADVRVVKERPKSPLEPKASVVSPKVGKTKLSIDIPTDAPSEHAKAIDSEISRLAGRLRKMDKEISITFDPDPNHYGAYNGVQKQIKLSKELSSKSQSTIDVGKGLFKACEDTTENVFRHEFGHHVLFTSDIKYEIDFGKLYRKHNTDYWTKTVSKYASTSHEELFAEAFSVYTHKDYKLGMLPKAIEDFLARMPIWEG